MSLRAKAIEIALGRTPVQFTPPVERPTELFGVDTFNEDAMRSLLSPETLQKVENSIRVGTPMDREVAEEVATAMRAWAISKGATHYTHWFQPLTGTTAEKHDSFFDLDARGKAIEKFKGSALVQQEPDASSFPSGGLRATFEARGYTGWDPSSPAFLMNNGAGGKTLCIPSVYISYTGEALDYKTPLLRSVAAIDKAASAVTQYFNRDVSSVKVNVGIEQEYFLVDKALYYARPDLVMTGRTVFGRGPARGQQLEDHYFGSISTRVNAFMVEFEFEALKLGIPLRTRHNEVAPGQYECAPTFEDVNLAIDHGALLMDLMQKVAEKHGYKVLFHEKPFDGINGSGKHNNWSLSTDTGINLLQPTSKPKENLRFLTFLVNVIKAVHDHADLLRASIASASNEYRLGAHEAPPSIISVFLGTGLTKMLEDLTNRGEVELEKGENFYYKIGISRIPNLTRDNTDRNRTSPFAFTGNKFEYRAVGSNANSASAMIVLNTIVANQLNQFKNDLDARLQAGEDKKVAIVDILKQYYKDSKNILFEGNGYSEEWRIEAARRGLSNISKTVDALACYVAPDSVDVFDKTGVLSPREVHARYEIELENYVKHVQIESRVIEDLSLNHIMSTCVKYQFKLAQTARSLTEMGMLDEAKPIREIIADISRHVTVIKKLVYEMTECRKKANHAPSLGERARLYGEEVKSYFERIRYHVDKLELLIDDEDWPLVKYRELLFIK